MPSQIKALFLGLPALSHLQKHLTLSFLTHLRNHQFSYQINTMAQKQNPTPMELKSSPPTVFRELPGPRPAPLEVSKESHKIRKSPSRRARVTFYQTSRSDFMSMVQSLSSYSGDGDLVPMARLASLVKTKDKPIKNR